MAKNNIAIPELTNTTETKDESLMDNIEEIRATKKAISVLYLALGTAPRKKLQINF